jgi:protein subunit release factor B
MRLMRPAPPPSLETILRSREPTESARFRSFMRTTWRKSLSEVKHLRLTPVLVLSLTAAVTGGGPGGQSVNKTKNRVQLLHKPTGISVTCHVTRSLATNRMLARRKLLDTVNFLSQHVVAERIDLSRKLDKISNLGLSNTDLKVAKERERERRRRKKAKNRAKGRNRADL